MSVILLFLSLWLVFLTRPPQIAELVSDVALALLRRESDWISGASELVKTTDEDKADDAFTQVGKARRNVL